MTQRPQEHIRKIEYGRSGTMRAVSNVLFKISTQYKFTSLAELNAVLGLYNLIANEGRDGSFLQRREGLLYQVTDDNGKKRSWPLKASKFYYKPTIANLEKKFMLNASLREKDRKRVTTAIDWTLAGNAPDIKGFIDKMEEEGISVVVNKSKKGEWLGVHYVDHQTKSVFDAGALDQQYQVKAIRERCSQEVVLEQKMDRTQRLRLKI
jgi:hypothetical protein